MSHGTQPTPTPTGADAARVAEAVDALRCFGTDLDLESAIKLLPLWGGFKGLTQSDRVAVLLVFKRADDARTAAPADEPIVAPDRCHGCGTEDLSAGMYRAAPRRVPMTYCAACAVALRAEGVTTVEVIR